jgi:cardiolipin synthase A/B
MQAFVDLPRWILELGFLGYVLLVTTLVLLERRRPTATLALLLALVFVPVLGLLAVLLLSRRRVRRRMKQRQRRQIKPFDGTRHIANLEATPDDVSTWQRGLVRLALRTAAAPLRRTDRVELLTNAKQAFDAVQEAIMGAQRSIHLEFYIWRDDATGRRFVEMLTQKAKQGVKVRVLYDHLGSLGLSDAHFASLRAAGGEVEIFGRLRFPMRLGHSRVNFRNHRKITTVDGNIGFIGGLNVGDEYFGGGLEEHGWRDLLVQFEGDAVIGLEATFLEDWLATTGQVIDLTGHRPESARGVDARRPSPRHRWLGKEGRRERALRQANPFAPLPDQPMASAGPLVQVIPSGPDIPVASSVATQFSASIASARDRAWIATPYFIPDEPLTFILRTAALRGIDVRILVPSPRANDSRLVAAASCSYYDELLEAGCRIFEYAPGMLHAKYLIVDELAAIGSANMDVRSFHINYEITAMFYDAQVTNKLAEVFVADLEQSREVEAMDRIDLPLWRRLAEGAARVLSPLL